MITNFEKETALLTEDEMQLVPILVSGFRTHNKGNPIKSNEVIKKMNALHYTKAKLTGPRLRKICNYICRKSIIPLLASSKGYYVSDDQADILEGIQSLKDRADAIMARVSGLEAFLKVDEHWNKCVETVFGND